MSKIPKKADKAIGLLDDLVGQLHYFYGNSPKFKKDVLKSATEIENILKDLAINKKETFKRIADKYKRYYEKRQQVADITNVNINESSLTEQIKDKYKRNPNKDSE